MKLLLRKFKPLECFGSQVPDWLREQQMDGCDSFSSCPKTRPSPNWVQFSGGWSQHL